MKLNGVICTPYKILCKGKIRIQFIFVYFFIFILPNILQLCRKWVIIAEKTAQKDISTNLGLGEKRFMRFTFMRYR